MEQDNIKRITEVHSQLKQLDFLFVFVGGATTTFYMSNLDIDEVRETFDVDCITNINSILEQKVLEKKLIDIGFKNDTTKGSPICRFIDKFGNIIDIMPMSKKILGFSNKWYPEGIKNKEEYKLPNGEKIFIFSLPYFLASKIEAWNGRGKGELRTSSDFEDILLVLYNCNDLHESIKKGSKEVIKYLLDNLKKIKKRSDFTETINGTFSHQPGGVKK